MRPGNLFAAVLAIAFAAVLVLTTLPAGAQLPGRQQTPQSNTDSWEVLGVLEWQPSTGLMRLRPLVTPTPDAPSPSPTATPSATPSPTITPSATFTVTPSNTPPAYEPTQETTPPPTPPPSTPVLRMCEGGVAISALRVRADHSTSAAQISTLYLGQRVVIERMYVIEDAVNEWAKVRWQTSAGVAMTGWVASYFNRERYLVWDDEAEECWPPDMPVEWESNPPISTPIARGVWVGQGADTEELLRFGRSLQAAGIQPAATVYGYVQYANELANAGWVIAYRPFYGDCMNQNVDPVTSARARWNDALRLSEGVDWDWLILNNECTSLELWWYKAYLAETVRLAMEAGIRGVVPHVFGSGSPELSWFGVLQPEHNALASIGGGFGFNSYPVREGLKLCSDDTYNDWTTYRYRMFSLPENLPIIVTEYAASWGEAVPDFSDIECYIASTKEDFAFSTAWYDANPMYPWENATLKNKLLQLSIAVLRGLGIGI